MSNGVLGEFIGTFVLILFGTGVGLSNNLNKSYAKLVGITWTSINLAWALAVMLGVYVGIALGSPAHLNPAISIAAAVNGGMPMTLALEYTAAQLAGGFLGAVVAAIPFWTHFAATKPEEGNTVGNFATGPAIPNPVWNFIGELVATFAFVFPVQFLVRPGVVNIELLPVVLGLLVLAVGTAFGSFTGYAINPARDLGPRLAYTLLPLPNKVPNSSNWGYAWVPTFGPIVGAFLAIVIAQFM